MPHPLFVLACVLAVLSFPLTADSQSLGPILSKDVAVSSYDLYASSTAYLDASSAPTNLYLEISTLTVRARQLLRVTEIRVW